MWLKKTIDGLFNIAQENIKALVILAITISLTGTAVLLAVNFSEQRDQNLLTIKAIEYRKELLRRIASDEEFLTTLTHTSNLSAPIDYKKIVGLIFKATNAYSLVEIRSLKGKIIYSQSASNSDETWPRGSRAEFPPGEVMLFAKAIELQKNFWTLSYSPNGVRGLELLVPNIAQNFVLVARMNPQVLLPPISGIALPKGIWVEFSDNASAKDSTERSLILPLDLNGINSDLIFHLAHDNVFFPDNLYFIVVLLGISLCLLMVSFFSETRKNKSMQLRLSEQEKTLAKQAQMSTLGEISTTLAHELNQPLATITNYIATCEIRLQQLGFQDTVLSKALNDARGQTLRAGEVVHSIRNFLRKGSTVKATIEIEEAIQRLSPILQALTKENRSTLVIDLKEGISVRIDPALFEQIIINLCKNALDAMSETIAAKRKLTIRSRIVIDAFEKKWVHIEVEDTGHGVSDENAKKLFGSFFTTKPEGMGIGLSLSRSVAESHGGKIAWSNNPSLGATFSIILPQYVSE